MAVRRYQVRGRRAPIAGVRTRETQVSPIDFTGGLNTGSPNDLQPEKTLRYLADMRYLGFGKYETRKGCDVYSVPIGEAVNVETTSTAGAADAGLTTTTWIAEKVTATADGVASKLLVNIKNSASAVGTVIVALYSDNSGVPGDLIARTSIDSADLTTSYAYTGGAVIQVPTITTSDEVWVVVYLQESGSGTMYVSSTTNSTNAKTSADNGQTWSAAAFSLNVKLYTATAGGVKGITRVYRPDGSGTTFFAHGENIYSVNDTDGTTTSVDSSINASSTHVRFDYVNDVLYYVDGVGKPRKYDFSASSEVSAAPGNAVTLIEHVGLLFYVDKADQSLVYFSNFADYDTFTSTDFQYFPAPKTSNRIVGLAKLNDVLYLFAKADKFMLLGSDNATFLPTYANAQKGTFSQESLVYDQNYIYFASDDGIYRFNGTFEENIAEDIIDDYTSILSKDDINLELHDNKLYVWYRPNGSASTQECLVYNVLYDVWEGKDLNTPIGRSFARHDTSDLFLQASNNSGTVYYSERASNDYNNLGDIVQAEARTAYNHFGSPQQEKRITYWRPIITTQSGNYSMQAGFAADYSNDVNFSDVVLQGQGSLYDDVASLYDAINYASAGASTDTTLEIFGSAQRWQRRYKHYAAREPFVYSGEVLKIQTRRLR
jgi:hypothetical protein